MTEENWNISNCVFLIHRNYVRFTSAVAALDKPLPGVAIAQLS